MENQNPNFNAVREKPPEIDRLSSLPDVILEDILSLLPTTAAAATGVLSRRWRHLWTRVTRLHFDADDFSTSVDLRKFLTTVDSGLCRLDSFSNIRYFYLRFKLCDDEFWEDDDAYDICCPFLNRWFGRVCGLHTERIDVGGSDYFDSDYFDDLFLRICVQNSPAAKTVNSMSSDVGLELSKCTICLPQCVFQSETLTELLLTESFLHQFPESINLPNLKKLSLRVFHSYRDLMRTLFKSLPSLEDLTLLAEFVRTDHFVEISAHNLKKISLDYLGVTFQGQISIDAPKLEHISIKSYSSLPIHFVSIPLALSSAHMTLQSYPRDDPVTQIMELLIGVSCVRSLAIRYPNLSDLNRVDMDAFPSFQNLTHLSLLLVAVQYISYECDIPVWLLRKVKTIEVKVSGNYIEMSALENILTKADVLERFCVSFSKVDDKQINLLQKENDFVRALFMFPRVSSRCEIQFKGMVVSASNDS